MDVGPLTPNISPQMDIDDDLLYVTDAYVGPLAPNISPQRQSRDSWWWRLLADLSAILLLLLDWLAPPREKRKNDDA